MIRKLTTITLLISSFLILTGFNDCPNEGKEIEGAVYEDNNSNTYIVGDSRIYFMRKALADDEASDFNWIAVCGSGYYHMRNEFASILRAEDLKGKTIIFESGLNDIIFGGGTDNAYLYYTDYYSTTAQEFIERGADVKMLRLLPILPDSDHNIEMNESVAYYNDALLNNIPDNIGIIDLCDEPLGYVDELHFDDETSIRLYNLLLEYKANEEEPYESIEALDDDLNEKFINRNKKRKKHADIGTEDRDKISNSNEEVHSLDELSDNEEIKNRIEERKNRSIFSLFLSWLFDKE